MSGQNLEQQATTLRNNGEGYAAAELYDAAKAAYQEEGDFAHAAGCQHMIGVSYKIENDIEKALPAYQQAITDYQAANDSLGPGRTERDIGIMYEYNDQLDVAQTHLMRSKQLLEQAPVDAVTVNHEPRDSELGMTLAKLGLVALRLTQIQEAEHYLIEGLGLIRHAGHPFYEITALMHMGSLYYTTEHYGRMLANLEAALGLIYEYGMQDEQQRRLAQIWGLMAHGYLKHNNQETARYFAKKSFAIINSLSPTAQGPIRKDIDAPALQSLL
jgi:tetratricopeptide (TPR) repeat protein